MGFYPMTPTYQPLMPQFSQPAQNAAAPQKPQANVAGVSITINNPQAFGDGTASSGVGPGGNTAGQVSASPQQQLMDAYNQAQQAYNNYMNLGRQLQQQASMQHAMPGFGMPQFGVSGLPPGTVIQTPNGLMQMTPQGLVPMGQAGGPPPGSVIRTPDGRMMQVTPQGLLPANQAGGPPPGAVIRTPDGRMMQMTPQGPVPVNQAGGPPPGAVVRTPDGRMMQMTPQGPVPFNPVGPPQSFNPGSTPIGPSVGPTQAGPQAPATSELGAQPPDLQSLPTAALLQKIVQPTDNQERLDAIEEITMRPDADPNVNPAIYNTLIGLLTANKTNSLTGADRSTAIGTKQAIVGALAYLNGRYGANTPIKQLNGYNEMLAILGDRNESPEVKKAVLVAMKTMGTLLNRTTDPALKTAANTVSRRDKRTDPKIAELVNDLKQGRPMQMLA